MEAYGQVTTGYWLAVVIGAVLLLTLILSTTAAVMRRRRPHRRHTAQPAVRPFGAAPSDVDVPVERCRGLIAEALTIRERMSGQIDAETYQARMKDLAWEASREGRAHRNAR